MSRKKATETVVEADVPILPIEMEDGPLQKPGKGSSKPAKTSTKHLSAREGEDGIAPSYTKLTARTGYVIIYHSRKWPWGITVGTAIPTSKSLAVKMAVLEIIKPDLDEIKEADTRSVINSRIAAKDYNEALSLWCDYMQKTSMMSPDKRREGEYAATIVIKRLPIVNEGK